MSLIPIKVSNIIENRGPSRIDNEDANQLQEFLMCMKVCVTIKTDDKQGTHSKLYEELRTSFGIQNDKSIGDPK